jgi:hypothetical protein
VQEEVIGAIPRGDSNTVLEVALLHDGAGGTEVELRCLVWGSGFGWYLQSTLTLDSTAARKLLGTLSAVQRRLKDRTVDAFGSTIIPFPHGRQAGRTTDQGTRLSSHGRTEARSTGNQR